MQNVINYTVNRYNCQGKAALFEISLEFYNRDKGRKALNLTEKYKNKSAGNEEKQAQRKESKKNVVSGYWR